jgi:hypothetical protein
MTQEEKQLLLKDLCARLPYGLWVQYDGKDYMVTGYGHGRVSLLPSKFTSAVGPWPLVEEVKSYLRPMSSMTEAEKEEIRQRFCYEWEESVVELMYYSIEIQDADCLIDWLNEHHFDYRGLIEKGLALEAPEGMYKTE